MTDTAPDPVAAYLSEARKNWEVFGEAAAMPALLDAVEAVLALHTAEGQRTICGACVDAYGEPVEWPCHTFAAISAALTGEGDTDGR